MSSGSAPKAEPAGPSPGSATAACTSRLVPNTPRVGLLALRALADDPAYPRYPRLPVTACPGHEPRDRGGD